MEQYYQEESVTFIDNYERRDGISQGKCNKSEESNCGFECNICLDLVQDPVVTFCGHLYCWPCIYKWIHFKNSDQKRLQPPQCPVCKAEISEKTLIPLFNSQTGKSSSSCNLGGGGGGAISIPNRPSSPSSSRVGFGYERNESMFGMYGQMVYARIFGNSDSQNSYHIVENSNPRLRRYLMEIDRSLSRVCIFFTCCIMFCLLLF